MGRARTYAQNSIGDRGVRASALGARWMVVVLVGVLPWSGGPLIAGNTVSGDLKGRVVTAGNDAPVAGATIEVRNELTGARWSTLSFKDGTYTIAMLSSGRYTVYCRHPDYQETAPYGPVYVALVKPTSLRVPPFQLLRNPGGTVPAASAAFRMPSNRIGSDAFPTGRGPGGDDEDPSVDSTGIPSESSPQGGTVPAPQTPALPPTQDAVLMVNVENGLRGGNFDERYLSALPLPGFRTFDTLSFLVAGVTEGPQPFSNSPGPAIGAGLGTPGQFSVNGMRSRANSFTLDGSDNNDQDVAVRRQGFLGLPPQPVESVQEFHIATLLWDAELGRNLGSQVNAVSKSGGGEFRGQVYGFLTSSELNARNAFDFTGGASADKDPFTRVQAGLTVGGPLIRNRTHVTGSFEYLSIHASAERHFATPRADERRFLGLPRFKVITSPASVNPFFDYETSAGATPLGLNLLSLYPLPNNSQGPFGSNTLTSLLPAGGDGRIASMKLDQRIGARHTLAGRYNFSGDHRDLPDVGGAITSATGSTSRSHNLSLVFASALSASWLNQARFSFGRTLLMFSEIAGSPLSIVREDQVLPGQIDVFFKSGEPAGGVKVNSSTGPMGELRVRPFSPVGVDTSAFPQQRVNDTFQYADNVSRVWRAHTLKFGADVRAGRFNSREDRDYRPRIEVNNGTLETVDPAHPDSRRVEFQPGIQFADAGQVSSIFRAITAAAPNSTLGLRFAEIDLFVNENWRIRPTITLDAGVRYEYNSVPHEVNHRIEDALALKNLPAPGSSPFDSPGATAAFEGAVGAYQTILAGRTSMYESDGNNFGPHLAVAWDPKGDGRTAIRAGYGVYYDAILGSVVSQSRNVFPTELPFLSEATLYGHDGLNANNPSFFRVSGPNGASQSILLEGTNQLAGRPQDFAALIGTLLEATKEAGGLTFTLPDRNLRTPYTQQWHLTAEREFRNDLLVSLSYVGTRGVKLTRLTTPNGGPVITPNQVVVLGGSVPAVDLSAAASGSTIQYPIRRRVQTLGAYRQFENSASSNYHALQLEARRRYMGKFTFTSAYTWSHAIDDASDIAETAGSSAVAQDSANLRADRSDAGYDVRHRFSASAILDLPRSSGRRNLAGVLFGNWQFATILTLRTGQPFTVRLPFDANLDGNLTDRPSSLTGLMAFGGHGARRLGRTPGSSIGDFFVLNRAGLVGRNTFRGDGVVDCSLALTRLVHFRDARRLELRLEIFNLLNRSNFGLPVSALGDPGFGSATNTTTPARNIQFAAKFNF